MHIGIWHCAYGCLYTSGATKIFFKASLDSVDCRVGCPKMHQHSFWHLTLCMWLSLYLRSHQKKFMSFRAFLWSGHHFLCLQRKFQKIQRKICHRTIFALISQSKFQSILNQHSYWWWTDVQTYRQTWMVCRVASLLKRMKNLIL